MRIAGQSNSNRRCLFYGVNPTHQIDRESDCRISLKNVAREYKVKNVIIIVDRFFKPKLYLHNNYTNLC